MTISHTWVIDSLEYADADSLTSVVNQINWTCVSDDGEGHVWNNNGSTLLPAPDPDTFEAFAGLTEADVLEWLGDEFRAGIEARGAVIVPDAARAIVRSADPIDLIDD